MLETYGLFRPRHARLVLSVLSDRYVLAIYELLSDLKVKFC